MLMPSKPPPGVRLPVKLVDAATSQPLELATVSLIRKTDNHPVKSMQTDMQGNFFAHRDS